MLRLYPMHSHSNQQENVTPFLRKGNNSVPHLIILAMSLVFSFLAFLVSIVVLCK